MLSQRHAPPTSTWTLTSLINCTGTPNFRGTDPQVWLRLRGDRQRCVNVPLNRPMRSAGNAALVLKSRPSPLSSTTIFVANFAFARPFNAAFVHRDPLLSNFEFGQWRHFDCVAPSWNCSASVWLVELGWSWRNPRGTRRLMFVARRIQRIEFRKEVFVTGAGPG